jgi:hypothetical protein
MRDDYYAIFQGKEFRLIELETNNFQLQSVTKPDASLGFRKSRSGTYLRPVSKEELESFYRIYTCAQYRGWEFGVMEEDNGKLLLTGGEDRVCRTFGFEWVDRGVWEKWVPKSELGKVWEVKQSVKL